MGKNISWKGLNISDNRQSDFSTHQRMKMWDLAVRTDDLSFLKTLIQKGVFPEEGSFIPLTHMAFISQSTKVLTWLLTSQEFQKEVRDPEFFRIITNHYDEGSDDSWFETVKILTPYLFGPSPVLDKNGDTLIFNLLRLDEFLFQDEETKEWLISNEVYPALEVPNKKGLSFFDNARDYLAKNTSMFSECTKNIIDELEILGLQKKLESLPDSSRKLESKRI